MSANAANVQLSYAEGELPSRTPPTPAASTPPAQSIRDAANPTDPASTPVAPSPQDGAGNRPTGEPSVAGPSTAESPATEKPRFSAIGKKLWETTENQSTEQPGPSTAVPPVSVNTPVSAAAKPSGVSAGTQTPILREGAPPAEAKAEASKATEEPSEELEVAGEGTEAVEELLLTSRSLFMDQVRELPVVQCTTVLYRRARSNALLAAPLALVECAAAVAAIPVKVAAWPFETLCPVSLFMLDWTLLKGLQAVLTACPCLNAPLNQVCSKSKECCTNFVCCGPRAVGKAVSVLYPKPESA